MEHEENDALLQDQRPEALERPFMPHGNGHAEAALPPKVPTNPFDTEPLVTIPKLTFDERVVRWVNAQDDRELLKYLNNVMAGYCHLMGTFLQRWEILWRDLGTDALDHMGECFRLGRKHFHAEQFRVWIDEASDSAKLTGDNLFIDAGKKTVFGAVPKMLWIRLFMQRPRFRRPLMRRRLRKLMRLTEDVYQSLG